MARHIQIQFFLKSGYLDMIFRNAFWIDDEFWWFDQEWNLENIPAKYPMYRAIVEMYHLEILGKLIIKLGGNPGYWINKKDKKLNWNSSFVNYGLNVTEMINYDIDD